MGREIKFRAWGKHEGKLYSFEDLEHMAGFGDICVITLVKGDYSNFIPMQFTGIKDKNNKEIYECDILLNNDGLKGKVFYEEGLSAFAVEFQNYNMLLMDYKAEHFDTMEILGNIYENPDWDF